METHTLDHFLIDHPFFAGLPEDDVAFIAGCGRNMVFSPHDVIGRTGEPADRFYVLRAGHVSIELLVPGRPPLTIQTLGEGDIFGWSWLIPPYVWKFDAHAIEKTRAIALEGKCLRAKCESDPRLGYELMRRFTEVMTQRLTATRLQLMDIYGDATSAPKAND